LLQFTGKSGEIWSKHLAQKYGPGGGVPRRACWLTEPFHNLYHDVFRHLKAVQKFVRFTSGDLQVVASS
jgi:hypothetical protein